MAGDSAKLRAAMQTYQWLEARLIGGDEAITSRGCVVALDDDPRWRLDNVLVTVDRITPTGKQTVGEALCQRIPLGSGDRIVCLVVFNETGRTMADELKRFGPHEGLMVPVWAEDVGLRAEVLTPLMFRLAYTDEELATPIADQVELLWSGGEAA